MLWASRGFSFRAPFRLEFVDYVRVQRDVCVDVCQRCLESGASAGDLFAFCFWPVVVSCDDGAESVDGAGPASDAQFPAVWCRCQDDLPARQSSDLQALPVRAPEIRVSEVRESEIRAQEVRAQEVRVLEVRAPEIRVPEIRVPEIRVPEIRACEVRACEVRACEVRACEVRAPEARAFEVRAPEVRAPEVRAREVRAPEVRAREVRVPEVRVPEVRCLANLKKQVERQSLIRVYLPPHSDALGIGESRHFAPFDRAAGRQPTMSRKLAAMTAPQPISIT